MFDSFKKLFKPTTIPLGTPITPAPRPRKPRVKKPVVDRLTPDAKAIATAKGEPYVAILSVDVDPSNINNGAFELDWNDKFLVNLIKAGYKMREDDKDSDIVDRWFHTVCRNVVMEVYEQEAADPSNRDPVTGERIIIQKPLGGGRTEVS
jgi:hypothetical protein